MDHSFDRFEYGAKIVLTVLMAMLPLWVLPLPVGLELGREISLTVLILAAFVLWLLSILTRGSARFYSSIITWAGGLLVLVFGVSTFFSKAPLISLMYGDTAAETFSLLLAGIILMVTAAGVLRSEDDAKTPLYVLILANAVAGLLSIYQLLFSKSLLTAILPFPLGQDFNVIGTMNGKAIFDVVVFVMALGLVFSPSFERAKSWVRYAVFASLGIFMINLMLIHFWGAWITLLAAVIVAFGLLFMSIRYGTQDRDRRQGRGFDWRYSLTVLLIALAVVMLAVKTPFLQQDLPAEVSPNFGSTWDIGAAVMKEGQKQLFLGSGPATFSLDWSSYRNPDINKTPFWGLRFNQGSSWVSTMMPTVGLLGLLAFLGFLAVSFAVFLRGLLLDPANSRHMLASSIFLGYVALAAASFMYPATITFVLCFFLFAGFLLAQIARPAYRLDEDMMQAEEMDAEADTAALRLLFSPDEDEGGHKIPSGMDDMDDHMREAGWFDIVRHTFSFENPWTVFVSSLVVIFLLALSVAGAYMEIGRARAAMIADAGQQLLNKGETDKAVDQFERAVAYEDKNYRLHAMLVAARSRQVYQLIQKAIGGQNVQQDFQAAVSKAIQSSQRSIELYPGNSVIWRAQGALYEMLIPFIPGSEKLTFDSYGKAATLDPINPSVFVDLGRSYLVYADRVQLAGAQLKSSEKEQFQREREKALELAMDALKKAANLKGDLAAAHFLMTQAAIRQGDLNTAIQSSENAKATAPFDIGIAFQLGLLYYQGGQLDKAQAEFERAVSLNANYSNARYFLGVIYDKKRDKDKAIQQFEHVLAFNPDNQEVKNILANLKAGRGAFEGIVPPNPPPEKRSAPPVKEDTATPAPRSGE